MIRNWLRKFMIGRYGPDQFGMAILILSLILSLITSFTGWAAVSVASYVLLLLAFFRMLSRNMPRRRAENDRFLRFWWPVRTWFRKGIDRFKARKQYKFFKCPACGNNLRVPKGKGKIRITCPKCGERFEKKT